MLYEVTGNLVEDTNYDIFCHQTNCLGVMGSGIAKTIRAKYPEVYSRHKDYCDINGNNVLGTNIYVKTYDGRTCVNMYAQYDYGRTGRYTNYDAFKKCLESLKRELNRRSPDEVVGFPYRIGCGFGGGEWSVIYKMLQEFAARVKQDVYIVKLKRFEEFGTPE